MGGCGGVRGEGGIRGLVEGWGDGMNGDNGWGIREERRMENGEEREAIAWESNTVMILTI